MIFFMILAVWLLPSRHSGFQTMRGDVGSSCTPRHRSICAEPGCLECFNRLIPQPLSHLFFLFFFSLAKILGKVGESLSRICCVRPPMERFTFVGMYRKGPASPLEIHCPPFLPTPLGGWAPAPLFCCFSQMKMPTWGQ